MRIWRVYGTTLLNAEDGIDWTLGLDVAAGDAPFTSPGEVGRQT